MDLSEKMEKWDHLHSIEPKLHKAIYKYFDFSL